ncbi:hypothetical protein O3Q51_17415 [Cryomorphaceae bacterium 1068]|nr:hypothetical protein [Cryomorphaceae bacterium 1068]
MRKLALFLMIVVVGCSPENQPLEKNGLKAFNETLGVEKSKALDEAVVSFEEFLTVNYPNQKTYSERAFSFLLELDSACRDGLNFGANWPWQFNTEDNSRIVDLFENSGLRRELWLYGYEEYYPKNDLTELLDTSIMYFFPDTFSPVTLRSDSILMEEAEWFSRMQGYDYDTLLKSMKAKREMRKNSLYYNEYGDFIYALMKYSEDSSYVKSYSEAQIQIALSPCVLVPSLIEFNETEVDLSDSFIKRIVVVEFYYPMIDVLSKK